MSFDSRTGYDVWIKLVADEQLSDALFAGNHAEAARAKGYTDSEIEVLDEFSKQRGTRWNIENLRFRAGLEAAASLMTVLPYTTALLCEENENWLYEICYEYLSHHKWAALGHRRLSEGQRFGEYVRNRIMKRRFYPENFESVLDLELAIIEVKKRTANMSADDWTGDEAFEASDLTSLVPVQAPTLRLLEQEVDLRPFLRSEDKTKVEVAPGPVTWAIYMPSLESHAKTKVLSAGAVEVVNRCDGKATAGEIGAAMEEEFDLPADNVVELIRALGKQGILGTAG